MSIVSVGLFSGQDIKCFHDDCKDRKLLFQIVVHTNIFSKVSALCSKVYGLKETNNPLIKKELITSKYYYPNTSHSQKKALHL